MFIQPSRPQCHTEQWAVWLIVPLENAAADGDDDTCIYGRNVPSMLTSGLGRTAVQDGRVSVAVVSCILPRSVEVNAFVCASSSRLVRGHAGAFWLGSQL